MKNGPIILVEDDPDNQFIFKQVLSELSIQNVLKWFLTSREAFHYLETTEDRPFIIFCDVNLPGKGGLEFKKELDANQYLRKKSIPFIFFSTSVDRQSVNEAYTQMTIQGFFKKPGDFAAHKTVMKNIFDYWLTCCHPNSA